MTLDDQVTARDETKRILNESQDALSEIEGGVDQINQLMVEFLLSGGLSEDAQKLADDVGAEANTLFEELGRRLEMLRKDRQRRRRRLITGRRSLLRRLFLTGEKL
jgi:hypothetical protein